MIRELISPGKVFSVELCEISVELCEIIFYTENHRVNTESHRVVTVLLITQEQSGS
jgi:hypothetical protein